MDTRTEACSLCGKLVHPDHMLTHQSSPKCTAYRSMEDLIEAGWEAVTGPLLEWLDCIPAAFKAQLRRRPGQGGAVFVHPDVEKIEMWWYEQLNSDVHSQEMEFEDRVTKQAKELLTGLGGPETTAWLALRALQD